MDSLLKSWTLPRTCRQAELTKTAKKLKYWQGRNAQARECHTKPRQELLTQLGIDLTQIPNCHPG